MQTPIWLSKQIVTAIHIRQIREHGGQYGIRDYNLLDSALLRPINRWLYEPGMDLFSLAAAYGFGIVKNHCFIDGNKRTAFMAMYVFLALNNHQINAPEPMAVDLIMGLAEGSISQEQLADWLRGVSLSKENDYVHE